MAPPPQIPPGMASEELPWVNRQSTILGICITLMVALTVTTFARLWARFVVIRKPWWDDLFVIIAMLSFYGFAIALSIDSTFGMGKHIFLISPQNLTKILKMQYIFGVCYHTSTAAIKVSLLFQYLLVFEKGTHIYRLTQLLLVVCALWGFSFVFVQTFSCLPHPSTYWKMTYEGCYGFGSKNTATVLRCIQGHAGSNFFLDVVVLLLAVRLQFLANVQSNRKSMAALLFIGLLSCSFALWRLVEVAKGAGFMSDPTFHQPGPALLSVVELYFATSCATLPFFWPVIVEGWTKIFVQLEFDVVSESRYKDDEVALANYDSFPGGSDRSGARSTEGYSGITKTAGSDDIFFKEQVASFDQNENRRTGTTTKVFHK